MTRNKAPAPPETGYTEITWAVHASYKIEKEVIKAASAASKQQYFSAEEQQENLLKEFRKIHGHKDKKKSALTFVEHYGLPVLAPEGLPVQEIVDASRFISFLLDLATELSDEVYGLSSLLETIPPGQLPVCEMQFLAKRLGLSESVVKKNFCGVRPSSPVRSFTTVSISASQAPTWSDGVVAPSVYYSTDDWKQRLKEGWAFRSAAQTILKNCIDNLMSGVQPVLDWVPGPVRLGWLLVPKFSCLNPWHAICLALFRYASGSSRLKRCKNPRCPIGFYVADQRSDARNCGRSGCRQYCTRKLKPIRKTKLERRKK